MRIDIKNLEFIDLALRKILLTVESDLGIDLTITSLFRIGDNGVHGTLPLRGIDCRMKNMKVGLAVENYINDKWVYDPSRSHLKVAQVHEVNGGGLHLHMQVHPNTRIS